MSDSVRKFIAAMFEAETGVKAVRVSQIGFDDYMIEGSDGNIYHYRG